MDLGLADVDTAHNLASTSTSTMSSHYHHMVADGPAITRAHGNGQSGLMFWLLRNMLSGS